MSKAGQEHVAEEESPRGCGEDSIPSEADRI